MRFKINLNLRSMSVPAKIEWGKQTYGKVNLSAYFLAPNPLPHPTVASLTTTVGNLESAFQAEQKGNKTTTQLLKTAELAFDNAFTELSHYVEDRANADSTNGATIIAAANMLMKKTGVHTKADLSLKTTSISGEIKVQIKAVRGAAYMVESAPNPTPAGTAYVWKQASVSTKATIILDGFAVGSIVWVRYARIVKGVQQDWSDPMSIVVN